MDAKIGHNKPPSQIQILDDLMTIVGAWFADHPIITTDEEARSGKLLDDQIRLGRKDLNDEKAKEKRPLQDALKEIKGRYEPIESLLDKGQAELRERLDAYRKVEEGRRLKAAEEARRKAAEAEANARLAEARELEAKDDARLGIVGAESDVVRRVRDADSAFAAFQKAERERARAEAETTFRAGGGIGRALSAHYQESLVINDPDAALRVIGWTEELLERLKTEARLYKRQHGHLPNGIVDEGHRTMALKGTGE